MRHIRIVLEDDDAVLLDEIKELNKCSWADLLLVNIKSKNKVKK